MADMEIVITMKDGTIHLFEPYNSFRDSGFQRKRQMLIKEERNN